MFLRCRHWNSTGGHGPQDAALTLFVKMLTLIEKPLQILVKMNVFTVRSLPTATQQQSGPRHARAARGLRVKCATWKSLENHRETLCFQCAPKARLCEYNSVLWAQVRLGWLQECEKQLGN